MASIPEKDRADFDSVIGAAFAERGIVNIDVSSHPLNLTSLESGTRIIKFSGSLTADKVFVLEDTTASQKLINVTTGAFELGVRKGARPIAIIPQGESLETI